MTSANCPSVVLMTADVTDGGWTMALELARDLGQHGVAVALAAMGEPPDHLQRAEAAAVPNLELFESSYRMEWTAEGRDDVDAAGQWLLDLCDRVDPDLVHLNGYVHAALPWALPTVVTAHSCVFSWWSAVRRQPAPAAWDRYRILARRGLSAADIVVTPTRAMLASLEQQYGPLAGTRVIHSGRDPSQFTPRTKQPHVLAASPAWDESKNIAALDEAARELDWPVYVAGGITAPEGPPPPLHYVHPLGQLPPAMLAAWLGRAAVYALPTRYEPSALSVLEAALAGCALVLGDIPSLRELWDETALFVDPDDPAALNGALQTLTRDATARCRQAQRSRARALELSPERMAHAYLEAYVLARMAFCAKEHAACG